MIPCSSSMPHFVCKSFLSDAFFVGFCFVRVALARHCLSCGIQPMRTRRILLRCCSTRCKYVDWHNRTIDISSPAYVELVVTFCMQITITRVVCHTVKL